MRNIKLTIAYDGADFHGWQIQPGLATIQGAIADAAGKITQERIFVHGASRTDAGVHAFGQVAHFKTRSGLTADEFRRALNALLPPQIRIVVAEEVGPDFHSRWQSLSKTYRYRIFRGSVLTPFEHRRALHYPWPLDETSMKQAARMFEGTHDFTSFAASSGSEEDDKDREMTREIFRSEISSRECALAGDDSAGGADGASSFSGPASGILSGSVPSAGASSGETVRELRYEIHGKSFLRYMVRKIVGTLLDVGKGKIKPENIPAVFEARDPSRSGPTVPPDGLYLVSLEYPDPTASLAHERRHAAREIG
ncbi:MAG TPA: tRNA pseudouridine synthase A [Candidatus Acidoferrales bacterium]|nr:tRNA pseudouridine synthase A [Candidatus Acidoferrales bacterium]